MILCGELLTLRGPSSGQGWAWQSGPIPPPQPGAGQLEAAAAAAPALSFRKLPKGRDRLRLGWDVSLWVTVKISPGEGTHDQTQPQDGQVGPRDGDSGPCPEVFFSDTTLCCTESQNHRMDEVGRDLWTYLVPSAC